MAKSKEPVEVWGLVPPEVKEFSIDLAEQERRSLRAQVGVILEQWMQDQQKVEGS